MRSRAAGANPRFERDRRPVYRQSAFIRRRRLSDAERLYFSSPRACCWMAAVIYRFTRNGCRFSHRRLVRPSERAIRAGTKVDRLLLKAIPKRIGEGAVLWRWLQKR